MPKTTEELIEKNERRARAKEKDAERKEKSRLYNLEMRAILRSNREEEAKERAKEKYCLKKEQGKENPPNKIQLPTKKNNCEEVV
jgi:hypothetical protein